MTTPEPTAPHGPTEPTQPTVAWPAPVEAAGPAPGVAFAPHGARLVAYLLDSVLLTALAVVVALVPIAWAQGFVDAARATGEVSDAPLLVLVTLLAFSALLLLIFGYFPFFWARGGRTPGMRPFQLVVVRDRDGAPIGWGAALLRMVGMYFVSSVFYLGFIWVFVDRRRRAWHDLIAGTLVVRREDPRG